MRVSLFCGEWAIVGVKSKCHEKDDKNGVDGVVNHVFRVDNDWRGDGVRGRGKIETVRQEKGNGSCLVEYRE